jgi:RHS repeat-associated protein
LKTEAVHPGQAPISGYGDRPTGPGILVTTYDWNSDGTLKSLTQQDMIASTHPTRRVALHYDSLEHMYCVSTTDALGHRTRTAYHPGLGVPALVEDVNGIRTSYQYDGFGRLRKFGRLWAQTWVDGQVTMSPVGDDIRISYLPNVQMPQLSSPVAFASQVISAAGPEVLTFYDTRGRPVRDLTYARSDGQPVLRDTRYDRLGRIRERSRPYLPTGAATNYTYDYDNLGRLRAEHRPDGSAITYTYTGRSVTRVDPLGNTAVVTTNDRDLIIRNMQVTDHEIITTYEYGPFDIPRRVIDSDGNVTTSDPDPLGRVKSIADPDSVTRYFWYNGFGDLIHSTAGTRDTSYTYDGAGRLARIDGSDGTTIYTWDSASVAGVGRIATVTSPDGVKLDYQYDSLGRLSARTWQLEGQSYTLGVDYDAAGRVTRLIYPQTVASEQPFAIRYQYGAYGELLLILNDATDSAYWRKINSDATNTFVAAQLGNGITTERLEDSQRPGVLRRILSSTVDGKTIQDLRYDFDLNGNLTHRADAVIGTDELFAYDPLDRLTRWMRSTAAGIQEQSWSYNDIGNIMEHAIIAGPGIDMHYTYGEGTAGPHAVTTTALGTYRYDPWGNQIAAPGRTISFTFLGLPRTITTSTGTETLRYDGYGQRVQKVSTAGDEVLTLAGLYERRAGDTHIFLIPVPNGPTPVILCQVTDGQSIAHTMYLLADHIRSIDTTTAEAGSIAERQKYQPFGGRMDPNGLTEPAPTQHDISIGFTGHREEDAFKLIDMSGRWYDPAISRFLTPDPILSLLLPGQELNPYSYVLNNPLSKRDPSGFQWDWGDWNDWAAGVGWGIGLGSWEVGFGGGRGQASAGGAAPSSGGIGGRGGPKNSSTAAPHAQDHSYAWLSSAGNISNFDGSGCISGAPRNGVLANSSFSAPRGRAQQLLGEWARDESSIGQLAEWPIPIVGSYSGMLHYSALAYQAAVRGELGNIRNYLALSAVNGLILAGEVEAVLIPGGVLAAEAVEQGRVALPGSILESSSVRAAGSGERILGGPAALVRQSNVGGHAAHMVAQSVDALPRRMGPSIIMEVEHHLQMTSTGSSMEAQAYRAVQSWMVNSGYYLDAFELEVQNITLVYGHYYDFAINQAREYVLSLGLHPYR